MTNPVVTVPLVLAAVVTTGFLRGRPRRVTQLTMMDSGFGVTAPPELAGYYLTGIASPGSPHRDRLTGISP